MAGRNRRKKIGRDGRRKADRGWNTSTVLGLFACTTLFAGALALTYSPQRSAAPLAAASESKTHPAGLAILSEKEADKAAVNKTLASGQSGGEVRAGTFPLCGEGQRLSCIVDGDTFWLDGDKIRIADIDTPELSRPGCERELLLARQATQRLQVLLNEGSFDLRYYPGRDRDRYGRKLRVVTRKGKSIGETLIAEGLARRWTGRKEPWC